MAKKDTPIPLIEPGDKIKGKVVKAIRTSPQVVTVVTYDDDTEEILFGRSKLEVDKVE